MNCDKVPIAVETLFINFVYFNLISREDVLFKTTGYGHEFCILGYLGLFTSLLTRNFHIAIHIVFQCRFNRSRILGRYLSWREKLTSSNSNLKLDGLSFEIKFWLIL